MEIVKEFTGNGEFEFSLDKTIEIKAQFRLIQYSTAKILITSEIVGINREMAELINMNSRGLIKVKIKGEVNEPTGKINVSEAYIKSISLNYNQDTGLKHTLVIESFNLVEITYNEDLYEDYTFKTGLTNLIFGGCEWSVINENGLEMRSLNKFTTKIDEFKIVFLQDKDYKKKSEELSEKYGILETCQAIIELKKNYYNYMPEFIEQLTTLLSYSSGNIIQTIYDEVYSNEKLLKIVLKPFITKRYNHRDFVINPNHLGNCNLKKYLETVYKPYMRNNHRYGLHVAIQYYLESKTATFLEMRYLLAMVSLESLLSNFEQLSISERSPLTNSSQKENKEKITKILHDSGLNIEEEIIDKLAKAVSYPSPFLNDKLRLLLTNHSIRHDESDLRLVEIRNKIVHTGRFPPSINLGGSKKKISGSEEYHRLIYLLDRIILTLLDYKGLPFLNPMDKQKEVILP